MKVRLESATCEGFGTCATHAPNLFELDEWGYAILKNDGQVPAGEEALARRAVIDCPVHAIITTEE
jgi:ferredoxin